MADSGDETPELEREIAAQVEEWSSNSTEVFEVSLWRGDEAGETFAPEFTYPIFGEDEAIFGYQGLKISLAFAAHNLKPHITIKHDRKFPDQGDIKATDVKEVLQDFLPAAAFSKEPRASVLVDPEAAEFKPPGLRLNTYKREGDTFEIYCAPLSNPAARQILENMQILVPLYIEGGTILELTHDWIVERWKLFLMYKVESSTPENASRYSLAGYATSFQTFTLPERKAAGETEPKKHSETEIDAILARWADGAEKVDKKEGPLSLLSRERLSQFIVLPPYQGQGLGSQLYNVMFGELTTPTHICEFTVEDPNEAFDDMRDVCDLIHLRAHYHDFAGLKMKTNIDASKLKAEEHIPVDELVDGKIREAVRKGSKIMPRQFARLVEMQTLSKIPRMNRSVHRITRKEKASSESDRAFYFWRLYAKQRLYIQNRDVLVQLDREDRVEKLEATVDNVQQDYERLLQLVDKRKAYVTNGQANDVVLKRGLKRYMEEENGDGDASGPTTGGASAKKRRAARVVDEDDEDDE